MHPLIRIGALSVPSHGVFVGAGVIVALWSAWRLARREGRVSHELVWIVAAGMVGAAFLARFGLSIRYALLPGEATWQGLLEYGGRSLLGGLAGAWLGVVGMKRLIGYRRDTGDLLIPGVALGIAIGRIGCFLAERPGTATTLPWGVRVPADAAARLPDCPPCLTGEPMHPSFVYESLFVGLLAWWLYRQSARRVLPAPWMREGDLFRTFLLAYAVFRFLVEFVRGNPAMAAGLTGSQLVVLPAALVLGWHFLRRRRAAAAGAPAA